ncbi:M48 family metallopeptidase [Novosphingobium sp. TH158]|uniref:tetratricopeptide repeat protein n=1 Tax=Novosphingobium sp. TH158 TaxID=2067455 RepID=UPI000C7E3B7C|nr:tetratricopeptide repeat protein [Novosphingobium sp. TH158]PLK24322.1 sporulation protein [Novosphingobium sp. TH158]
MASRIKKTRLNLFAGAVMAVGLLAGCAAQGMTVRNNSAEAARLALKSGKGEKAVSSAEAAVAASPRDASLRVLLGQSYFKAGRFQSAATTFDDAMKLGDNSARTALSLALAQIGAGQQQAALSVLDDWRGEIPASDLGLALALAGEPERGVAVLADALRNGENTPKIRQNLAYAYALAGRWKEARIMASQDVPADKLDVRLTEWASSVAPELYQKRVATLLNTPIRRDAGQPAMLALANNPAMEQVAAETTANPAAPVAAEKAPVVAVGGELPAADAAPALAAAPAPVAPPVAAPVEAAPVEFAAAPAAPAPRFVSEPVVQNLVIAPARQARAVVQKAAGTHLVQLGSFSSPQGARRAWGIYSARNSALSNYHMQITPAVVRGKNVWRVAAAGISGAGAANGLCSSVKKRGGACFAYAAPRGKSPSAPGRDASGPMMARKR